MNNERSLLSRLYPTTKFMITIALCMAAFIVPGYGFSYAVLPICMVLAYFAGSFKEFSNLAIKALLMIVVFIFILQSFFYPGNDILWSWSIFSIKREGLEFALFLTSKIVAVASAFILFFRITKVKDLVHSLEQIGLPSKVTYVILSTLQLIPEMKKLTHVIMDAQKTRGVETEGKLLVRMKAFLPTLSPLILGSVASTEERVLTLESRAFSANVKKSSIYKLEKTKHDRLVQMLLVVLLAILIVWRVAL